MGVKTYQLVYTIYNLLCIIYKLLISIHVLLIYKMYCFIKILLKRVDISRVSSYISSSIIALTFFLNINFLHVIAHRRVSGEQEHTQNSATH